MKKIKQSSSNSIYLTKVVNEDYIAHMILLFYPCNREKVSTVDHPRYKTAAKSTFVVEGLDDGFYKEYEVYAHFIIDTTAVGPFYTSPFTRNATGMAEVLADLIAAFQQQIDVENIGSSVSGIRAIMNIDTDNIFCFTDSALFDIKSALPNTIVFSLDMIGLDSDRKRYRLKGENIMATSKGYSINKQGGKQSIC